VINFFPKTKNIQQIMKIKRKVELLLFNGLVPPEHKKAMQKKVESLSFQLHLLEISGNE
jgi:hypothetical protein